MLLRLFILIVGILIGASNAYADTHAAASCSLADVQAAIAAAARGDTVTVPAGKRFMVKDEAF